MRIRPKVRERYQKVLDRYLKWIPEESIMFLPNSITYEPSAPAALICMFAWETHGVRCLETCEPALLARYIQGKKSRDWHISEWLSCIIRRGNPKEEMALFYPEEFLGVLGMDTQEFVSVFEREPDESILRALKPNHPELATLNGMVQERE